MIVEEEPNRIVRFFQMTVAEKHDVDMEVLRHLSSQLEANVIEFYFIVPTERMTLFRPGIIKNKSALSEYHWPTEAVEIKAKMCFLGMDGWSF
jgi:hypothetical protein